MRSRFHITLAVVCLANLASLSLLACSPAGVADGPSVSGVFPGSTLSQTPAAPTSQGQTSPPVRGQAPPASQRARFERLSTANGLSFPLVRAVLQDHQGFMWFATWHGLNKYDGYQFTVYTHDPGDPTSIRNDDVDTIFEDSDGVLWIGHGGGLDRFDRETETFTHVDTRGQVFSIYEDSMGTLWVGFWHGLYGYDRDTNEMIHFRQPDPEAPDDWGERSQSDSAVMTIYEDRLADLWIGTVAGLVHLDRKTATFTRYRHNPDDLTSLTSDAVTAIYEDRQGTLWIGTVQGLDRLDRSSGTFTHFRHDPDDVQSTQRSLSDDEVTSILEDSAGNLWIGTSDGLIQLDPSVGSGQAPDHKDIVRFRHDPRDPQSLSDDVVLSLYEDRSGVLWVATTNGVSKYVRRTSQFTIYRESPLLPTEAQYPPGGPQSSGLSDGRVAEIYEDRDGILWIGTLLGGLNRLDRQSGKIIAYQHDPAAPASLSNNTVRAVYEDHSGDLWVGTGNGWLERFDRETETFTHHLHLGEFEVADIAEDLVGNLWIGTWGEGLYRLAPDRETLVHYEQHWRQPDHWKQYGTLSSHITWAIYVDQAGVPWVGTYHGGINLWDAGSNRFTHYRHDPENSNSLSHDYVLSFWEDPTQHEEVMWIGTMGGGLNRLDRARQTFTQYTEQDGLSDNIVGCILGDDSGFLWLGTPNGLSRFDPGSETFRNYDERDGLIAGMSYPKVCFRSRTGEMFFGGGDGFYAFDPGQIMDNLHIPPIVITALKVFNQTTDRYLPADRHIGLSHAENYLSFEFAALDYTAPERNQYAYMLEGLDEDWVYAGTRRHADYPNLRPGDYVFRVKGSNNDGVWNEDGVAVRITVEPPIWETGPFRVMIVIALVLGAVGVYRQRVRNIEARSRALERQVEEEIDRRMQVEETLRRSEMEKAVAAERSRLARELHDAVTQTLFSASLVAEALPASWERDREEGRRLLQELRQSSRGALAEMRTLLLELRPAALVEADLGDLMRQLAEAATGREGLPVRVAVEGKPELPSDVHVALYRIAQEALNNVVKHARASQAMVRLRGLSPASVELHISDDGRGFDPANVPPDHLGLGIMRERAEAIGAALEIDSQPGHGTRVTVVWEEGE
jgi:signal transduction histidine kinase/ligand-binding sensor domain-containing protein